jgi:hypothetical protein
MVRQWGSGTVRQLVSQAVELEVQQRGIGDDRAVCQWGRETVVS